MDKGYVLVVDDEPHAGSALAELVQDEGYRVETAADTEGALAKLEQGDVDILLTDLKMPGMDGVELLRQLRAVREGGLVAVVMTAYGAVDTAVSAMKEGATDYITKPVRMAELIPALERGMARRRLLHEAGQARLRLEAANRDLEAFARRVAHDPLMPITVMAGHGARAGHGQTHRRCTRRADHRALRGRRRDVVSRTAPRARLHGGRRKGGPGQVRAVIGMRSEALGQRPCCSACS